MPRIVTSADCQRYTKEMPWEDRGMPQTLYAFLSRAAERHGDEPAISFQLTSGPTDRAETRSWAELKAEVTQFANLLERLGIGEGDVVAYALPNCLEAASVLLGGATAAIVMPVNPLLEASQIAAMLRETGARAVVTLRGFPKTDLAQKMNRALSQTPSVEHLIEVDLADYLGIPKSWLIPFMRPKIEAPARITRHHYRKAIAREPSDALRRPDPGQDRVAAIFPTGGTTGAPKLAKHRYRGMIYNGWLGQEYLFTSEDVMICPLPLFHVFAAYPILMSAIGSGAHVVFPTPGGYRGEGVFDNFWSLIARWKVTFLITVPTAMAALMQRPVNADVSSLRLAISGSAPLPVELANRFKTATGVDISEGYGLTEATCLVSINPIHGMKKIGSVGVAFPYCTVKLVRQTPTGPEICAAGEIGEICICNPGVAINGSNVELDPDRKIFDEGHYLRSGDLGRIDEDGYLWITGRAKDLIIRGGHNIDPASIEEVMVRHDSVAFAAAIGQPDAFAGELPCVYLELLKGHETSTEELLAHAHAHIPERAAVPKHLEVLAELPKTAVGKVFKPALRKQAITRVLNGAFLGAGLDAEVAQVVEDKSRGLVAEIRADRDLGDAALGSVLDQFTIPWRRL